MLDVLRAPIVDALATHLGGDRARIDDLVAPPTKAGSGDLSLPCFVLAKDRGVAPPVLASELAAVVDALPGCTASAAGPFVNIRLDPGTVAGALLPVLQRDPDAALRLADGAGRTVCIDFSSPNIAKHLAFHHIRSTMIGNALAHCYGAAGWRVVRINFLGDWGTAFGRLIAGWKREGHGLDALDAAPDKVTFLGELYVRISQAAEQDPAVATEARDWSRRLEEGDPEARALWQRFKDASLSEFRRVYALLGVDFDSWKGEAHYEDRMGAVLAELADAGLLVEDQGAQVVDLSAEGFAKPVLIRRADGGTLYATRDLAACQDRFDEFAFDRSLYVVDLGQSLHFKEWFAVATRLGKPYADRLRHVGFGVVLLWNEEEGKYLKGRTRSGGSLKLTEVLDESISRARAIVEEKNAALAEDEKAAIASAVGVGAVVFNDLKNQRKGDVRFRFEDALNMQGETGPYLQFAHARLCSIERRYAEEGGDGVVDPGRLAREDEKAVLLAIATLGPALRRCVDEDEPYHLAGALLGLAAAVSSWLTAGNKDQTARVIGVAPDLSASRIALVGAARGALGGGLRLLGLQAPERM